ncbi:MAG: hypothetical protein KDM81_10470, partial [Verrucomicrobiae bacterium]|nr:hypothetical protein [Verrucomicrobiae bacterium]
VQLIERSVPPDPPPKLEPPPVEIRIGAVGRALTDLKPGGRVEFDSTWLDGVTDGGIISAGERIEVVERMPTGLRVRAIPDQAGEGANERGEAR